VPLSLGFQVNPWVDRVLRIRQQPPVAYGSAGAMVAVAVLARWLIGDYLGEHLPFITFYPAIVVVTLVAGLWPGILATILSTIAAWYLFLPPAQGWELDERELLQLLLFLFICAINVAVASLINALIDRLVLQQRNIRLLLDAAPNGFVLVDERGTIKLANASTGKLFGYAPEELAGQNVDVLVPHEQADAHREQRLRYQDKPQARPMGAGRDLNGRRKDGSEIAVEIGLNPVGQNGKRAVLATVVDISRRKRTEASQRLLIAELQHRTRNVFTVVQAIIVGSLKQAATVDEARRILNGRVKALAHAYALLPESWEGVSLRRMIDRLLAAHAGRIAIEGCDVTITSEAAQQFALIVHELATNALKYGALSVPGGRVEVSGNVERHDERASFVFSWRESDGPRVAPPTRRGFGSTVLRDSARRFAGRVAIDYTPEGLNYRLHVDFAEIDANQGVGVGSPRRAHSGAG
jgi:PAS domain S-box-containing protein